MESRRSSCSARTRCTACWPRRAGLRRARGTDGGRPRQDRRRAAGCEARATPEGASTARSRAARSDPHHARRAPRRAAPPACSTAPSPRRESAMRARCHRGGAARRSPPCAGGRAPRRRAWWRPRRSSAPEAAKGFPCSSYHVSGDTYLFSTNTSCASQLPGSRGSHPPRSSSSTRLPVGARWRARVPPPAPLPMMITS